MDFNSFPREIRDQIYKECLVNSRISSSTGNTRGWDIGDIDRHVRRTFGVLDGDTSSHKFADEARAVFYTDNTFTEVLGEDIRRTRGTVKDIWTPSDVPTELRPLDKADLKLGIMLSEIQPYSYIRKIAVQLRLELRECGFVWTDRNRDPSQQLRELLQCPKLQEVEILIQGPEGIGLGHEVARMIVKIWDVIEALYKRFGDGFKGMDYLLALKAGCLDDSDEDEDAEAGRNSGGFNDDHGQDHDDRDGGEYGRYRVDERDETYDYGYDDYA